MRILAISEHYFPITGGSTSYVYNLCKSLSEIGCEVRLVTMPDDKNPVSMWCAEENFHVYRLKIPRVLRKERYFPFFLSLEINRIINEFNPDIVHFTYGFFAPLVTRLNRKVNTKPVVWTIHNIPPYEHALEFLNNLKAVHDILEKIYFVSVDLYGRAALKVVNFDRLICVSEKTAGLVKNRGVNPEKIKAVPNGVPVNPHQNKRKTDSLKSDMNIRNRYPLITTVAGIWPNKGLEYLIQAAPMVLKEYPNALFTIIGHVRSKGYYRRMRALIHRLDLEDSTRIIPGASYEELMDYYAVTDLYVQPSLEEAFCMSILEAMAFGKPVVGSKTGAIPEFIEESGGGVLVDSASSEQIYHGIIELLRDPKKMDEAGKRSRRYVLENFAWKKVAEKTLRLYENLKNGKF